jgi:hypothetical protein
MFRDLGDRYKQTDALTHLGDAHAAAADPGAAARAWHAALAILTDLHNPQAADQIRHRLDQLPHTSAPIGDQLRPAPAATDPDPPPGYQFQ